MISSASLHSPVDGELMNGVAALTYMKSVVSTLNSEDILIVSAYMKMAALKDLLEHIDPSNRVRILVRWQANDLLMGASDTGSYAYARARNWDFYARQDLHAKIYCFGQAAICIGSANLTSMGFSLSGHGNVETMVRVQASDGNIAHVVSLLAGAVKISDPMVADIQAWIDAQQEDKQSLPHGWPPALAHALISLSKVENLMTSECFVSDGMALLLLGAGVVRDELELDLSLLAIPYVHGCTVAHELLLKCFMSSKMFRWLGQTLAQQSGRELYFGAASSFLHSALLDDPQPYRKDVKILLANLLSWVALCPTCGIVVDRPNYSQRIRLLAV